MEDLESLGDPCDHTDAIMGSIQMSPHGVELLQPQPEVPQPEVEGENPTHIEDDGQKCHSPDSAVDNTPIKSYMKTPMMPSHPEPRHSLRTMKPSEAGAALHGLTHTSHLEQV